MKREPTPADELRSLLDRWCEGEQDERLGSRISRLVREDPELAWDYLCHMELHAALRCHFNGQQESPISLADDAGEHRSAGCPIPPAAVTHDIAAPDVNAHHPTDPTDAASWLLSFSTGLTATALLCFARPGRRGVLRPVSSEWRTGCRARARGHRAADRASDFRLRLPLGAARRRHGRLATDCEQAR